MWWHDPRADMRYRSGHPASTLPDLIGSAAKCLQDHGAPKSTSPYPTAIGNEADVSLMGAYEKRLKTAILSDGAISVGGCNARVGNYVQAMGACPSHLRMVRSPRTEMQH